MPGEIPTNKHKQCNANKNVPARANPRPGLVPLTCRDPTRRGMTQNCACESESPSRSGPSHVSQADTPRDVQWVVHALRPQAPMSRLRRVATEVSLPSARRQLFRGQPPHVVGNHPQQHRVATEVSLYKYDVDDLRQYTQSPPAMQRHKLPHQCIPASCRLFPT